MISKALTVLIFSLGLGLITGCGRSTGDRNRVLSVSIEPQRYLLEAIAGPDWEVRSILSKGEDPESYDPTMSDFRKLNDSEIYFTVGTIPFEEKIAAQIGSGVAVVRTSEHVDLLEGTHGHDHGRDEEHEHEHHGHSHEHEFDPHIWASVGNLRAMAGTMLEALVEKDPANAEAYKANFKKLSLHLDSCGQVIESNLSEVSPRCFVVWHPSLSYYARDYNLEQLALGSDNKEFSARAFRSSMDGARSLGAGLFLVQPDFDAGRSLSIASEAGLRSETINTLAYDLPTELIRISQLLKHCFNK